MIKKDELSRCRLQQFRFIFSLETVWLLDLLYFVSIDKFVLEFVTIPSSGLSLYFFLIVVEYLIIYIVYGSIWLVYILESVTNLITRFFPLLFLNSLRRFANSMSLFATYYYVVFNLENSLYSDFFLFVIFFAWKELGQVICFSPSAL